METPAIANEKYVSFTTYKRDGSPKPLPVWIADLGDGTVGFTTSSSSYKVKRLRNNPAVTIQPSNSKGEVKSGTEALSGTGSIVQGAEFDRIRKIVKKKYGIQYTGIDTVGKFMKLIGKGSGTDTAIVIALD